MATRFTSRVFLGIILYVGLFLFTNFEKTLGSLILFLGIGAYLLYQADKNRLIDFQTQPFLKSLMYGIGGYIFFIITAQFIATIANYFIKLNLNLFSLNSVIQLYSQTNLALQGNQLLQFIGIGFLIALVETAFFFGPGLEILMDLFNVRQLKPSLSVIAIFFIMASIFTYFHLTAKGVNATEALVLVFYFAMVSMFLVLVSKELLPAIIFHIIANSISQLPLLGITLTSFGSILLVVGIIGGILYFAFRNVNLQRIIRGASA